MYNKHSTKQVTTNILSEDLGGQWPMQEKGYRDKSKGLMVRDKTKFSHTTMIELCQTIIHEN